MLGDLEIYVEFRPSEHILSSLCAYSRGSVVFFCFSLRWIHGPIAHFPLSFPNPFPLLGPQLWIPVWNDPDMAKECLLFILPNPCSHGKECLFSPDNSVPGVLQTWKFYSFSSGTAELSRRDEALVGILDKSFKPSKEVMLLYTGWKSQPKGASMKYESFNSPDEETCRVVTFCLLLKRHSKSPVKRHLPFFLLFAVHRHHQVSSSPGSSSSTDTGFPLWTRCKAPALPGHCGQCQMQQGAWSQLISI